MPSPEPEEQGAGAVARGSLKPVTTRQHGRALGRRLRAGCVCGPGPQTRIATNQQAHRLQRAASPTSPVGPRLSQRVKIPHRPCSTRVHQGVLCGPPLLLGLDAPLPENEDEVGLPALEVDDGAAEPGSLELQLGARISGREIWLCRRNAPLLVQGLALLVYTDHRPRNGRILTNAQFLAILVLGLSCESIFISCALHLVLLNS